jgi:hypothetical protein
LKNVQAKISTPKSPQEVYDYLVDFERHPEWRFDVLESRLVQGETGRVGARYRQKVKQGRRDLEVNVELTEAQPGRRVGFRTLDEGPVSATGSYSITDTGAGSEVVNDVAIETHGFVRLFEPFMGPQLRKTSARYEEALGERLR